MKLDYILDMVKKSGLTEYTSTNVGKTREKEKVTSVSYNREAGLSSNIEDVNGNKKGLLESFDELEKSDIDTQRDYMAIMSNTLSRGDFNELMKEGYSLSDSEVKHIVTVVDKIKIKLAEAGVNTDYTRDVSQADMESVLGSTGRAVQVAGTLENAEIQKLPPEQVMPQEQELPQSAYEQEAAVEFVDVELVNEALVSKDNPQATPLTQEQPVAKEEHSQNGIIEGLAGIVQSVMGKNQSKSVAVEQTAETVAQVQPMTKEEQLFAIAQELTNHDLPVTRENVDEIVETLDLALEIGELSDHSIKYMLTNELEPTVMNVYRAEFSSNASTVGSSQGYYTDSTPGYYAKKPQELNWQAIEGQMERIITQAGLLVSEDTIEGAKWLVENGVPLTETTIAQYMELRQLSLPVQAEDMLKNIIYTMKEGKRPQQVPLTKSHDRVAEAAALQETVAGISDDALKNVILSGKEITIQNLAAEQAVIDDNAGSTFIYKSVEPAEETSVQLLTARRQLEELRLMMTTEASLRMMKQGIQVETTELSKLVEELKSQETRYKQVLFEAKGIEYTEASDNIYTETTKKMEELSKMPMYALGRFAVETENPTVNEVYTHALSVKTSLEQANTSYETMMTSPRKDLGDSIYKAFRNIDSILQDISMEPTESNVRAVKILAFNQMTVNRENITLVKQADTCVNRLIQNMTGDVTLELIRRGKNPLDTDIYHLNEEVEQIKSEMGASTEEKYSEFLWKAEKTQGITPEQRSAYIGIYRLFHQIEKSEGSVVGALVAQGTEVTLRNLITGVKTVRTTKTGGIRAAIDDDFGGVSAVKTDTIPMEEQITAGFSQSDADTGSENPYSRQQKAEQYYNTLIQQVMEHIEPEKLSKVQNVNNYNISLESFAQQLKNLPANEEVAEQFYQEKMQQLKQARTLESNVIKMLLDFDQPVTVNNLVAADSLMNERGKMIKRLMEEVRKSPKKNKEKEIMDAAERVTDGLISKEAAEAAYENLVATETDFVEEAMTEENLEYVDVRSLKLLHQEIKLTKTLSKEENYEIPVQIKDELTSINLKIIRGDNVDGNVSITMESEAYGKIAASFHVKADRITGFMVSDTEQGYTFLRSMDKSIKLGMAGESYRVTKLNYAKSDNVDLNQFSEIKKAEGESKVSTKALYQCAKAFIGIVKENA